MKIYRFSPMTNVNELQEAAEYVIEQSQKLISHIAKTNLQFSGYLTICSHYYEEFETLKNEQRKLGVFDSEHNGTYVLLTAPITTEWGPIERLRVRHPDPYRYQVGCGDFHVNDYEAAKNRFLSFAPYVREIVRPDLTMLEFWHPDFDVTAYIVK